jgi:hypothetical protein
MVLGGIVGGVAGASTNSFETGSAAGRQASLDFFHKYGLTVFLCQILVFSVLCTFRLLPGVAKYKK